MYLYLARGFLCVTGFQMPEESSPRFHETRLRGAAGDSSQETQKNVSQRVDQDRQDFVTCRQRQQTIELCSVTQAFLVSSQASHFFGCVNVATNRVYVGLGRPFAGESHQPCLDQQASFRQIVEGDGTEMDKVLDNSRHTGRIARADKSAPLRPVPQFKDSCNLKATKSLAQGAATDIELLGEFPLRRKLVARAERADRKLVTDPLAHFLESAPAPDRLEREGLREFCRRTSQRHSFVCDDLGLSFADMHFQRRHVPCGDGINSFVDFTAP